MSQWQRADFRSDFLIPDRTLEISKNALPGDAFREIVFWVREQGVAIGDRNIYDASTDLHEFWKQIPDGSQFIVFEKKEYASVEYQYQ